MLGDRCLFRDPGQGPTLPGAERANRVRVRQLEHPWGGLHGARPCSSGTPDSRGLSSSQGTRSQCDPGHGGSRSQKESPRGDKSGEAEIEHPSQTHTSFWPHTPVGRAGQCSPNKLQTGPSQAKIFRGSQPPPGEGPGLDWLTVHPPREGLVQREESRAYSTKGSQRQGAEGA